MSFKEFNFPKTVKELNRQYKVLSTRKTVLWETLILSSKKWINFWKSEWKRREGRNGKGVWFREIEKALKRFDASLEWLLERIGLRDEEIDKAGKDEQIEERAKKKRS